MKADFVVKNSAQQNSYNDSESTFAIFSKEDT